jgi:tetratricopeptide (TPR) repeat protein
VHAEAAYLFRHALLREAAYQLLLPEQRSLLHESALQVLESLYSIGGELAEAFAQEAADHALLAQEARRGVTANLERLKSLAEAERKYVRKGATYADRMYRHDSSLSLWRRDAELNSGAERVESLAKAASAAGVMGKQSQAEEFLRTGMEAAAHAGNRAQQGRLMCSVAMLYQTTGRPADAEHAATEAEQVLRAAGEVQHAATAVAMRGIICHETGRVEEAMECYRQALAAGLPQRGQTGRLLGNLGTLLMSVWKMDEARKTLAEALAIHRETGNRLSEGIVLGVMGTLEHEVGNEAVARQLQEQALAIHREVGNRRYEGVVLGNIGIRYFDAGEFAQAERFQLQALAIARETGDRRSEGLCLGNLALCSRGMQRREAEESLLLQALEIQLETRNERSSGITLGNLATLYVETGRNEQAAASFERSIEACRKVKNQRELGRQACRFATFLVLTGSRERAQELWREGCELLAADMHGADHEYFHNEMVRKCTEAGIAPLPTSK